MSTPSLPDYPSESSSDSQLDDSQDLPTYTRTTTAEWDIPRAEQQHGFHLESRKTGVQWLTLKVVSRAASAADQPTFYQGGNVTGTVQLTLEKPEAMDQITIDLFGRLTIFSHTTANFLCVSRNLFSAAAQNPLQSLLRRSKLNAGQHEWPYSFRLPKGVNLLSSIDMEGQTQRQNYRLPPSFSDPQSNVHIEYSLVVRVNRGGFRSGSKLVVPFKYVPLARPGASTILRQLAYQQNSPVVGPDGDPGGWKTLEPAMVDGILFKTMFVTAKCLLSISRPLTYTRGGLVHLVLSIEASNKQFLDLITPDSLHVALIQRITFGDPPETTRFSRRLAAQTTMKCYDRGNASWWHAPLDAAHASTSAKVFAGEIAVPEDLTPGCQILHYGHEYEVVLYPLTPVGFTPNAPPTEALVSEVVTIVTAFAQGPRPSSHVPPEYGSI
ncbi:hypothetical protein L226DRAFT_486562 [Lentinus tigrinus ALCF2SS1-7]|uniref:Arrestin-like N-terminal domain-containing protein n=1 Tax=Lentinus tigrinus ALCF2SS1-6 TaxID=1328759 RepID=A0A5C2S8H0_9APHY|nr:hypothetical protein L227DRAFT_575559 [Lentinus tigrinus ALCF2SS1-6]RPD74743.1 hypothetical protein L226DRAFT_486562 [Lentinus tigrinus ALCF2SS1-7]